MNSLDNLDEETPLVVDNSPIKTPKNYTRDVYVLSSAFLLVFLAYGAAQNLESTVNTVSFSSLFLFSFTECLGLEGKRKRKRKIIVD